MRFSPPILVDVDEVLLQWSPGFRKWMTSMGHPSTGETNTWEMLSSFPTVPNQTTLDDLMYTFSTHADFGRLEPVEDAVEGVAQLRYIFPDSLVVGVTACGSSEATTRLRRINLRERGFPIDHVITLSLHSCKRRVYSAFRPGIVIDDAMPNLIAAKDAGHRAIAFDRPWNKDWQHLRLPNWRAIEGLFSRYRDI